MPDHERKPKVQESPLPADFESQLADLKRKSAEYRPLIEPLKSIAVGKTILDSAAGRSGYALYLDDGSWIVCFLRSCRMEWEAGTGEPPGAVLELISSSEVGDGGPPLTYDYPYASQTCDIAAEVAKSHGQVISSVLPAAQTFNFGFLEGHEVDANIVTSADGKPALRVFWEQW